METPIIYSFLLYILYLALPLLPAIVILKLFPKTPIKATGMIGNLQINTSGAFAAYVIVATMSFFLVKNIEGHIKDSCHQVWTVTTKITFFDKNGKQIEGDVDQIIDGVKIDFEPPIERVKNSSLAKFCVPTDGETPIITFGYPKKFNSKTFPYDMKKNEYKIDEANRTINIDEVRLIRTEDLNSYKQQDAETSPIKFNSLDEDSGPPIEENNN
ncbi:MAG: hypothetical protein EHM58_02100 [Ignavibacteriae bacterium]|nr:MAG: hypothetical protein EHM58_02100 [Ignavibacteriota bacterium]